MNVQTLSQKFWIGPPIQKEKKGKKGKQVAVLGVFRSILYPLIESLLSRFYQKSIEIQYF